MTTTSGINNITNTRKDDDCNNNFNVDNDDDYDDKSLLFLIENANIVTCGPINSKNPSITPNLLYYRWMVFSVDDGNNDGKILDIGRRDSSNTNNDDDDNDDHRRLEEWRQRILSSLSSSSSSRSIYNNKNRFIIDAHNKLVLPGLWDAHCHLYSLGHCEKVVNLSQCMSIDEMKERLRNKIKVLQHEQNNRGNKNTVSNSPTCIPTLDNNNSIITTFLEGVQWDQEELSSMPNRYDLDDVTTEYPIICWRRCWHIVAVNSKALEICNITGTPFQIEEGVEVDSTTNLPTGILKENAINLLSKKLLSKEDTYEEKIKFTKLAIEIFVSNGIVGVQTNDTATMGNIGNAWQIYNDIMIERMSQEEKRSIPPLPCRILLTNEWQALPSSSSDKTLPPQKYSKFPNYLRCERTKLVMDGALGASTAALTQPYSDNDSNNNNNNNKGMLTMPSEVLQDALQRAYENEFHVEAHAIGDAAFDQIFTAIEQSYYYDNDNEEEKERIPTIINFHSRPVITHCQILNPDLLDRIEAYNNDIINNNNNFTSNNNKSRRRRRRDPLICNIQPQFVQSDAIVARKRLGDERLSTSYIWKTLLSRTNCVVAGGSDAPVEIPCSLQGICDALQNTLHADKQQNLSLSEALALYTINAAYAGGMEDISGCLQKGYKADFIITELNSIEDLLFEENNKNNLDLSNAIKQTFVGGHCVYDKEKGYDNEKEKSTILPLLDGPGKSGRPIWRCPCCQ